MNVVGKGFFSIGVSPGSSSSSSRDTRPTPTRPTWSQNTTIILQDMEESNNCQRMAPRPAGHRREGTNRWGMALE